MYGAELDGSLLGPLEAPVVLREVWGRTGTST